MACRLAKVLEEEIEEAFFYPSDLVNTKTTIGEDIYLDASHLGIYPPLFTSPSSPLRLSIYPPLFTSPSGDSCILCGGKCTTVLTEKVSGLMVVSVLLKK